jgi:hypothetical protein
MHVYKRPPPKGLPQPPPPPRMCPAHVQAVLRSCRSPWRTANGAHGTYENAFMSLLACVFACLPAVQITHHKAVRTCQTQEGIKLVPHATCKDISKGVERDGWKDVKASMLVAATNEVCTRQGPGQHVVACWWFESDLATVKGLWQIPHGQLQWTQSLPHPTPRRRVRTMVVRL